MARISTLRQNRQGPQSRGDATRAQLLEAAGIEFAAQGFDRATAKAIAERARTNTAAVNYYFGGIEGLYEQVLVEAHGRLFSYQEMANQIGGDSAPKVKLRRLIEFLIKALVGPAHTTWAVRVLAREILSPTPFASSLRKQEFGPKLLLVLDLVAGLLGLPARHPAVFRTCLSIAAPCMVLLLSDQHQIAELVGISQEDQRDAKALADHLTKFALGGIAAVSRSTL